MPLKKNVVAKGPSKPHKVTLKEKLAYMLLWEGNVERCHYSVVAEDDSRAMR
jgi:hypothetical protein